MQISSTRARSESLCRRILPIAAADWPRRCPCQTLRGDRAAIDSQPSRSCLAIDPISVLTAGGCICRRTAFQHDVKRFPPSPFETGRRLDDDSTTDGAGRPTGSSRPSRAVGAYESAHAGCSYWQWAVGAMQALLCAFQACFARSDCCCDSQGLHQS